MKDQHAELTIFFGDRVLWDKAGTDGMYLESIYDQYAECLFRYALALAGSAEDAEDAVQEVFARIAREVKRLRKIENLRAYLYTSTRNAAFSILRARKHRGELEESACVEWQETPGIDSSAIAASIVCEAFPKLPADQREVLVLKIFDNMTFREIAETIGVPLNTVTARYRYGIDRLRRALGEDKNG